MNTTFLHCLLSFSQNLETVVSNINFFIHETLNLTIDSNMFRVSTMTHETVILLRFCFLVISGWTEGCMIQS
jgi:hypothetical protein